MDRSACASAVAAQPCAGRPLARGAAPAHVVRAKPGRRPGRSVGQPSPRCDPRAEAPSGGRAWLRGDELAAQRGVAVVGYAGRGQRGRRHCRQRRSSRAHSPQLNLGVRRLTPPCFHPSVVSSILLAFMGIVTVVAIGFVLVLSGQAGQALRRASVAGPRRQLRPPAPTAAEVCPPPAFDPAAPVLPAPSNRDQSLLVPGVRYEDWLDLRDGETWEQRNERIRVARKQRAAERAGDAANPALRVQGERVIVITKGYVSGGYFPD